MEEEASSRRSVAELAGKFKVSVPTHEGSKPETEKPVRRRPPRTLQIPKPNGDQQQPAGVTSPLPAKAKRNSALIEKLQANLALSPTSLLPSPKSPGFRLFPSAFTPPSPNSAPVSTVTSPGSSSPVVTSPFTEEERPASFETPPTATEGSILSHANKARVRLSIRRRPPSRRHRKSSSGDEVANGNANEVTSDVTSDVTDEVAKDDVNTNEVANAKEVEDNSVKEPTETTTTKTTVEEEEEVFKADSTDAATCLNNKSHEEETQPEVGEEPKMEDASSSAEKLEKDSTETTNTESKEEEEVKIKESTSQTIEKSDETSAPV